MAEIKLPRQRITTNRSSHGAGWLTTGRGKVIVRILQKRFTKTQLKSALDLRVAASARLASFSRMIFFRKSFVFSSLLLWTLDFEGSISEDALSDSNAKGRGGKKKKVFYNI